MFDWSGLIDRANDMFKGSDFEALTASNPAERLPELLAGSQLIDGVPLEEILSTLGDAGIDVTALTETDVAEVVSAISENGGAEGIDLSKLFDRSAN